MHLADLCRMFEALGFPAAASTARPPRDDVRTIQAAVERGVQDDTFLADCFELELTRLDHARSPSGLSPFLRLTDRGIRFSLGCWRPGASAGAHEHTDWTVTAVCHNELEVATFDRRIACTEGRLVPKNRFAAPAGRAGHIYDPCVHEPRNPTSRWSLSFHIQSPHDGVATADGCTALPRSPGPRSSPSAFLACATAHHVQQVLRVMVEVLATSTDARAATLLAEIFGRGNARTRDLATDALIGLDRGAAIATRMHAARDRRALAGRSRVATRGLAPELDVRVHGEVAELVAVLPAGHVVLLRTDHRAAPALRVLATERELVVGELPGGLDTADQVALVAGLQEWGLFGDAEPAESAASLAVPAALHS